jgi:hypothetical protein
MKVQIIKKGSVTVNAKPQGFCVMMIDEAPMNKK